MDFQSALKTYIEMVDETLQKEVAQKDNIQFEIYQAMRYSLFAGGKRVRPVLTLAACETVGGNVKDALPFAAALEMIHTYSLIHDDLPAMDNDDLRRGKPTSHKKFGEAMAILAGDALLNQAYQTMLKAASSAKDPVRAMKAAQIIADASGTEGMIGGQVAELAGADREVDEAYLKYVNARKTGALITASVVAGAIIGGADESQVKRFEDYGNKLGLAFQIQDDILDVVGDEAVFGKPVGSDQENNKDNFVTMHGTAYCQELVQELTVQSIQALVPLENKTGFLTQYAKMLLNREY